MNQKKAKMLRRSVDKGVKNIHTRYEPQIRKNTKGESIRTGAVECIGVRAEYLKAKKEYKNKISKI